MWTWTCGTDCPAAGPSWTATLKLVALEQAARKMRCAVRTVLHTSSRSLSPASRSNGTQRFGITSQHAPRHDRAQVDKARGQITNLAKRASPPSSPSSPLLLLSAAALDMTDADDDSPAAVVVVVVVACSREVMLLAAEDNVANKAADEERGSTSSRAQHGAKGAQVHRDVKRKRRWSRGITSRRSCDTSVSQYEKPAPASMLDLLSCCLGTG
jgi:hypothetical protein